MILFYTVALFFTVWFMYCKRRTDRDRAALIRETYETGRFLLREGDTENANRYFNATFVVTSGQHLRYRLTLRNPKRLYKL